MLVSAHRAVVKIERRSVAEMRNDVVAVDKSNDAFPGTMLQVERGTDRRDIRR